ncbi:hypothetical protein BgiBS90_027334, partial [Biomphalaria glabrata]
MDGQNKVPTPISHRQSLGLELLSLLSTSTKTNRVITREQLQSQSLSLYHRHIQYIPITKDAR